MTSKSYELFYSTGGHGGPYLDIQAAREAARNYLDTCRGTVSVSIVQRDPNGIAGYGRTVERIERFVS